VAPVATGTIWPNIRLRCRTTKTSHHSARATLAPRGGGGGLFAIPAQVLACRGGRRIVRRVAWYPYQLNLLSLALVVGAATLVVTRLDRRIVPNLASTAKVTASSRSPGGPDPEGLIDGNAFQTGQRSASEQNPWVQLELPQEQTIHRIVVYNQLNWWEPRPILMILKLSRDGQAFEEIARTQEFFTHWDVDATRQIARYVRVETLTQGILELNEIEVR